MFNYNYCWIVVGFISFLHMCYSNYIYNTIKQDLNTMDSLKFRVYILSSPALILYISDFKKFKSFITIKEIGGENFFMYKGITKMHIMKMKDLCNLLNCSINYVSLEMEIKKHSITTVCNNKTKVFRHEDKVYRKDFEKDVEDPDPKNKSSDLEILHFWMGNMDPPERLQNKISKYWRNQLFGCLDEFSVNTKSINFEKVFSYFSSSCDNYYKNHILSKKSCSADLHNFSCSISKNEKENQISKIGLSLQNTLNNSLRRTGSNEDLIFLQLTWEHSSTDNYCLIEMKFGSHSVVIQVLQSHVDMVFFNNGNEYERKILHKILKDSINDISITLNNSQPMGLKVMDNMFSIECYVSIVEELESLNIGFAENKNDCRIFSGKINFRYNASQLAMQTMSKDVNFGFYVKIFFVFVTLIIIAIGALILKLWRNLVSKIPKLNIYETSPFEDRGTHQIEQTYDDGQTYESID